MRLATLRMEEREQAALRVDAGYLTVEDLNRRLGTDWPETLAMIIESGRLPEMIQWYRTEGKETPASRKGAVILPERAVFGPLYRRPPKIWGIGLNYVEHATDLDEQAPTAAPASFMKPATAIIGPGETIRIPELSRRTTAEAELGVIIGKRCKDVPKEDWLEVVAGFTPVIDMTAEDILRQNPRYLTVSKSFDTFFSFGPELVTPDQVEDVTRLRVATVHNGRVHARNTVDHMTFPPAELIAYHSRVMTLVPGDIISTGTPGATVIGHGDTVECRITGFEALRNPVIDLKHETKGKNKQ